MACASGSCRAFMRVCADAWEIDANVDQ